MIQSRMSWSYWIKIQSVTNLLLGHGSEGGDWKRYLVNFIGDARDYTTWLEDKLQVWEGNVQILMAVAHQHLQAAYAGLQNYIQQEWSVV